jgi:hypothetical protein
MPGLALHEAVRAGNSTDVEAIVSELNPSALLDALRAQVNGLSAVEVAMHSGNLEVASQLLAAERRLIDKKLQLRLDGQGLPPEPAPATTQGMRDDPRVIDNASPTCPWEAIQAYAADQEVEAAAQRGPRRTDKIADRYQRYSAWCALRGHTGVDLILATAMWIPAEIDGGATGNGAAATTAGHGPTATGILIALEPNIVPYHLDPGIEHWILWYHPTAVPGNVDLDASRFVSHVRRFLPSLRADDELVAFQNLPQFRSVPQMAHAHVFLRPTTTATIAAVAKLRAERRLRSPWAEAERMGGRADEVGWDVLTVSRSS